MDPKELLQYVRAEPFRPFALHLLDGRMFQVRHPELIAVAKRSIIVFSRPDGPDEPYDDWVLISPVAISTVEFVSAA